MLSSYKPWWLASAEEEGNGNKNDSSAAAQATWKKAELLAEAERRGLTDIKVGHMKCSPFSARLVSSLLISSLLCSHFICSPP